jgi:predicted ATPase
MSLREARFDDHWRHVYERQYPTRLIQLSFQNLYCFEDSNLAFTGGISAIVGGNGVGKSTLAAAIAELLEPKPADTSELAGTFAFRDRLGFSDRLKGSRIQGVAHLEGRELHLSITEDGNGSRRSEGDVYESDFRLLDPSSLASECVTQIYEDTNFDDLLESVTPLELNQEELGIASYIVGKNYSSIRLYEIADYANFDRFPYFVASAAGVEYGSEAMGRGELSTLLCYWTLRDMSKNSILLLEEPETHVSPKSQDALMNVVAKFSDENGIWTIITTHSPTVVRRIPQKHIRLVIRENGPSSIARETTYVHIARLLGGGVAFRGVMLVEDEAAKGFLLELLDGSAPELVPQFEVVVAGSDSHITEALRAMPLTGGWLNVTGVYDGDMGGRIPDRVRWPAIPLPGGHAPDHLLKSMAERGGGIRAAMADALHKSEGDVAYALNVVAGVDHHDFVRQFAASLNQEPIAVRRTLTRMWLKEESNSQSVRNFAEQLRAAINSTGRTV